MAGIDNVNNHFTFVNSIKPIASISMKMSWWKDKVTKGWECFFHGLRLVDEYGELAVNEEFGGEGGVWHSKNIPSG